jgi:hypothetical protein
VPFEDSRLVDGRVPSRRLFTGTSADMAAALSSLGMGHVAHRLAFLGSRQLQPASGRSSRDAMTTNTLGPAPMGKKLRPAIEADGAMIVSTNASTLTMVM